MWQFKMFFCRCLISKPTWVVYHIDKYTFISVLCKNICTEVFLFWYFSLACDWPLFFLVKCQRLWTPWNVQKYFRIHRAADHKNIWRFDDRTVTLLDEYTKFKTREWEPKWEIFKVISKISQSCEKIFRIF